MRLEYLTRQGLVPIASYRSDFVSPHPLVAKTWLKTIKFCPLSRLTESLVWLVYFV